MTQAELTALNFFQSKGLSRAQAAGIVGNIQQESSGNPNAPGGGLFQGQAGRAGAGGSLQQQLGAVWSELSGPYLGALHALQRTSTPEAAAAVFETQFEKPAGTEGGGRSPSAKQREQYAHEAFEGQTGGLNVAAPFEAVGKGVEEGAHVLEAGAGVAEATGKFFAALVEPSTWLRIVEGLGGIVLVYMGLSTLARSGKAPEAVGTLRQATSGPRKVAKAAAGAAGAAVVAA